jgi:predicted transcriptional regulator
MHEPQQSQLEGLALMMLVESKSITPFRLADRANVDWFVAREVLEGLVKKGLAAALRSGRYGRTPQALAPASSGG